MTHDSPKAALLLIVAMVGFGTIGVFTVNAGLPALQTTFWRCVFAAAALLMVAVVTGGFRRTRFTTRGLVYTGVGGVALITNWWLLTTAFQSTSITTATVAYHSEPFFLVLLGAVLSRSMPRRREIAWLLLAAVGLLLGTGLLTVDGLVLDGAGLLGMAAATGAGFLYAVATLAAQRTTSIDPVVMTLLQVLLGVLVLWPFSGGNVFALPGWGWVAAMGVVHTGLLYAVMYASFRKLRVITIASIAFVNPAVAILTDILFYAQTPAPSQIIGIALIVLATFAATLRMDTATKQGLKPRSHQMTEQLP